MIFCHHPIIGSATPHVSSHQIDPLNLGIFGHQDREIVLQATLGKMARKTWGVENHVASKFPEKNKKLGKNNENTSLQQGFHPTKRFLFKENMRENRFYLSNPSR